MASFKILSRSIQWVGQLEYALSNPANIQVLAPRLQIKAQVEAMLLPGECYCAGFVQICTEALNRSDYGHSVNQRWEFSSLPLSDSENMSQRPFYGYGWDVSMPVRRFLQIEMPADADLTQCAPAEYDLGMSDRLTATIAKRATAANGQPSDRVLNSYRRFQSFRTWLVAVPVKFLAEREKYTPLLQWDWEHRVALNVKISAGVTSVNVIANAASAKEKSVAMMDPLPEEAFKSPICNQDQELSAYLGDAKTHTVVARGSDDGSNELD